MADDSTAPPALDPLDGMLVFLLEAPLFVALGWMRLQVLRSLDLEFLTLVGLLRGPMLGFVGFVLLSLALLMAARGTRLAFFARVVVLTGMGVYAFVELAALSLYRTSHTVLDAPLIVYAVGNLVELLAVLSTVVNPALAAGVIALLIAGLAGTLKLVERRYSIPGPRGPFVAVAAAGMFLTLLGVWMPRPVGIQRSLGRSVPTNLLATAWTQQFEPLADVPPTYPTPTVHPRGEDRPNLVIVGLESTRARSTTAYQPDLLTTPRFAALAADSLLIERAYANFGHTTKAWVSIWCSLHPIPSMAVHESELGGVPVPCLPDLLEPLGYDSVFFTSATADFEGKRQLAANLGFDEATFAEDLDPTGYERANYFGWEDAILLPASEAWITANPGPFVAFYMTGTPHHDYLAPQERYGRQAFSEDETTNLYLNSVAYLDHFVEELIAQYKRLGLYENTVFVFVGDHGEGLGEHFKKFHNDCLYEECVRIPFVVHGPGRVEPRRSDVQADQLDIVPTALDAIGMDVQGVGGRSVLGTNPRPQTTFISCWYDRQCIASVRDRKKLIHFFDDVPDALYDLESDPDEQHDLHAAQPELAAERREELLEWYRTTKGRYLNHLRAR